MVITAYAAQEVKRKATISCRCMIGAGRYRTAPLAGNRLWVEQVAVPDYLAGNGVVYSDQRCTIRDCDQQPVGQPAGSAVAQYGWWRI